MYKRQVLLDGSPPTLGAYLLRWLLILVDTEILTPLVAIITIAANGKGQRIGDIAAGTTVVKTTKRVTLSQVAVSYTHLDVYKRQLPAWAASSTASLI